MKVLALWSSVEWFKKLSSCCVEWESEAMKYERTIAEAPTLPLLSRQACETSNDSLLY